MPTNRSYAAPDTPRYYCQYCGSVVWLGRASGRVRNDTDGARLTDSAHTCIGYDDGYLRPGHPASEQPEFLSAEHLAAERFRREMTEFIEPDFVRQAYPDIPFEGEEVDVPEGVPEGVWWSDTHLPSGVRWLSFPAVPHGLGMVTTTSDYPEYPEIVSALRSWAEANGLDVRPERSLNLLLDAGEGREPIMVRRPIRFHIGLPDPEQPYDWGGWPEWEDDIECPYCSETHLAYTALCGNRPFSCFVCAVSVFAEPNLTLVDTGTVWACTNCAHTCSVDDCETWILGNEREYCDEHRIDAYCVYCDVYMERTVDSEPFFTVPEGTVCANCRELFCENCNRYYRRGLTWNSDLEANVCRRCLFVGPDGTTGESFDDDADMTNKAMQIPTIPGRENVRQCGIEIEGANGTGNGQTLAQAFYEADLSSFDGMAGYHHGDGGGFVHVERDSSVDWEAVIGPLNPANQTHVRKLNSVVRIIREHVKDGTLGLDLRAGCHIHVEAARTSLGGAFNLNTLFAYLEDVIFRLAAARWPVHRAIMDTHYTAPIPKGLRKLQFAREHHNSEDARYYALSFQNYFSRVLSNCHCGAVRYDSWEDCECDLGKCTFEFRVFNTTANPRKLHAYMALAQALVAKAMSIGELDNASEQFPALEFRTRRFKDMPEVEQQEITGLWRDRLAWMFNELPLTDPEKESIAYCIRHSELEQVGEEFIESLLPEQQTIEEAIA